MPALFPSEGIRARVIDGLLVVLDLKADRYSILDDIGTAFWRVLTERADDARGVGELCSKFGAPADVVESDLRAFRQRCIDRGWLTGSMPLASSGFVARHPAKPTPFYAWRVLLETITRLWTGGLIKTYAAYAGTRPSMAEPALSGLRERALGAFLAAENAILLPGGSRDCLPRSLALFVFLKRCGIDCNHVIGVQRTPFQAHAWVEIEGEPVLERLDQSHFHALARL